MRERSQVGWTVTCCEAEVRIPGRFIGCRMGTGGGQWEGNQNQGCIFQAIQRTQYFISKLKSKRFKKGLEQKHPAQMENSVPRSHKGLDEKSQCGMSCQPGRPQTTPKHEQLTSSLLVKTRQQDPVAGDSTHFRYRIEINQAENEVDASSPLARILVSEGTT